MLLLVLAKYAILKSKMTFGSLHHGLCTSRTMEIPRYIVVHLSIHWRTFSNAVFLFKSTTITGYNESSGAEFMFGKGMLILLFSSTK